MPDVLIVDDDPAVRGLVAMALEGYGFTVRQAEDGVAALHALREQFPDVLVVDLMMPGLDGFGLLRAMRQQNLAPGARKLILTCKGEEQDYVTSWELGADEYMSKPFEPERLARRLQDLLMATPELLQERREAELQKSELLDRLEVVFNRPRQTGSQRNLRLF